jgi:hypothetical protein
VAPGAVARGALDEIRGLRGPSLLVLAHHQWASSPRTSTTLGGERPHQGGVHLLPGARLRPGEALRTRVRRPRPVPPGHLPAGVPALRGGGQRQAFTFQTPELPPGSAKRAREVRKRSARRFAADRVNVERDIAARQVSPLSLLLPPEVQSASKDQDGARGGAGGTQVPEPLSPGNRGRVAEWDTGPGADVGQRCRISKPKQDTRRWS